MYHAKLPQSHIDKAAHRMPGSGYTRFQQALEEGYGSAEILAWLAEPKCPFNRRGRDGKHPLVSSVARIAKEYKKTQGELGEMPKWWNSVYPNDTRDDWVRRETQTNIQQRDLAQQALDACLAHVSWKDWKSDDVAYVLKALELRPSEDDCREKLMVRLLEAGLPVERLRYEGAPITPAMWSLLHHYHRVDGSYWLRMPTPMDPPGHGPGYLSVALMQWGRLWSSSLKDHMAEFLDEALGKGITADRPLCPKSWFKEEDEPLASLRKTYNPAEDVVEMAHALDHPRLVAIISRHAPASDASRIASVKLLMHRAGEHGGRYNAKESTAMATETLQQVLHILETPAQNPKAWRQAGAGLLECYFESVWPRIPMRREPKVKQLLEHLVRSIGELPRMQNAKVLANAAKTMVFSMKPYEMADNVENAIPVLEGLNIPKRLVASAMVPAFVARACQNSAETSRSIAMVEIALQWGELNSEALEKIGEAVFRNHQAGLSLPNLKHMIAQLEQHGWQGTSSNWKHLHDRIQSTNHNDSADVLIFLIDTLARHAHPPQHNLLLPPNMDDNRKADSSYEGYGEVCEWNMREACRAHEHMVKRFLERIDINDVHATGCKRSPLHTVAQSMDAQSESNAHMVRLAEMMLQRGADPRKEPPHDLEQPDDRWVDAISSQHPFFAVQAQVWSDKLDADTPLAPASRARRRI